MGVFKINVDNFKFFYFIGEHQNLDRDWGRTRSRSEQKPQLTLRGGSIFSTVEWYHDNSN
jgi:hypothetical protein